MRLFIVIWASGMIFVYTNEAAARKNMLPGDQMHEIALSAGFKTVYEVEFIGSIADSEGDLVSQQTYKRSVEATSEADVKVLLNRLFDNVVIQSIKEKKDGSL